MGNAIEAAYRSAFESELIIQHDQPGVIELRGKDRIDLLHRLSTNDLEGMPADRIMRTIFTDPVGRTIDAATVLTLSDKLLLATSSGRSQVLHDWLQRHIFFQDDVVLKVLEGEWRLFGAYGPKAADHLPSATPPVGSIAASETGIFWSTDRPVSGFQRLVAPDQAIEDWHPADMAESAFEILRIEDGLPKMGAEILDDSIPLEVGLRDSVSFDKGCYIGQEIIARMESRGKLAKQLVGVKLESQAEPGDILRRGEVAIGTLSSVAHSPRFGWIGLASIRTPSLAETDGRIVIGKTGGSAQIVELPFVKTETPAPA